METNLKRLGELKQEVEKKHYQKTWDMHFQKKSQAQVDLGLNDPKYLKQLTELGQGNESNDPHYDEMRGYFLQTYKKQDTSPLKKSSIMRKKKEPAVVMEMLKSSNKRKTDLYDTPSVQNSNQTVDKKQRTPIKAVSPARPASRNIAEPKSHPRVARLNSSEKPLKQLRQENSNPKTPIKKPTIALRTNPP